MMRSPSQMASTTPKFQQTSRMLVLSAVFISLSVPVEPRECYWCGPLAEQVHRSQRAPSCNAPLQTTACELGLTHCAIVATAPPYAESRYCVKLYQDECYPLFCNTTRSWRMICPCRGDRCNGPNTDREKEAFAILNKLVSKSRNKRTAPDPSYIDLKTQPNITIENDTPTDDNMTFNEFVQSSQPMNEILGAIQNGISTAGYPNTNEHYEKNLAFVNDTVRNINDGSINMNEDIDTRVQGTKLPELEVNSFTTTRIEIVQNAPATGRANTNAKEQFPTAEALQHHVSPQIKQTEAIATTMVTSTTNLDVMRTPTTPSKNFAATIHVQITIIRIVAIISLFLY